MRNYAQDHNDAAVRDLYKKQRKYFIVARREEKALFNAQPEAVRESFRWARKEVLARYQLDKTNGKLHSPSIAPIDEVGRPATFPTRGTTNTTLKI